MGARPPHTMITRKSLHSNKNQSPPHKGRSLPCAASTTTTPTRRHLDTAQPTHHKLELELNRSRRGTRPISSRSTTDLAAELDRSRHGLRPISTRRATGPRAERGGFEPPVRQAHSGFQDRHIRPLCHLSMPHNHSNYSMLVRATRHYHHRPEAQRRGPCGQASCTLCVGDFGVATPLPMPTRASRLNRLNRINGIGRADRRQPREKNPRLRVGLADAGTGEAGLSRRPSAKACAIAGHTGRRGMSVACRAW